MNTRGWIQHGKWVVCKIVQNMGPRKNVPSVCQQNKRNIRARALKFGVEIINIHTYRYCMNVVSILVMTNMQWCKTLILYLADWTQNKILSKITTIIATNNYKFLWHIFTVVNNLSVKLHSLAWPSTPDGISLLDYEHHNISKHKICKTRNLCSIKVSFVRSV